MQLTFLGKESAGGDSPTLYATDRDTYVIQGWNVDDETLVSGFDLPTDTTCVEIPPRLLLHLAKDGVDVTSVSEIPPVVHVTDNGNYIVQGPRVHDADALAQMRIPDYESCVEVAKAALYAIVKDSGRGVNDE